MASRAHAAVPLPRAIAFTGGSVSFAGGANDAKRRHARWQLHDTFRKELVERFNHISAKLDQAKKPEILR